MATIRQAYEPWSSFANQEFEIKTEKTAYTMPFVLQAKEDNASAEFWLGGPYAYDLPATLCFDNVAITRSDAPLSH
jgi:hypothetical protein